jgi:prepilin-type processing-associated H-X9-DG protein
MRKIFVKCFTLIELLTVISIIALIAGLLFPVMAKVRQKARLTECMNNLRQVGIGFSSYLSENQSIFPIAAMKPTVNTTEPRISDVLSPYAGDSEKIFRCPSDTKPESSYSGNTEDKTFFEAEGCSFEYASMLGGRKLGTEKRGNMSSAKRVVMFDFECFHRESSILSISQDESETDELEVASKGGAKNYLFADWHVSDKFE